MLRKAISACALVCVSATCLMADFSYEQSSKITGGMIAKMMKLAGAFSKTARDPVVSTVMVKGDRMASVTGEQVSIMDLKTETMTMIDMQKKTYSTITFAEMAQAMAKAAEKMGQKPNTGTAEMNFKANVVNTGQTKQIAGQNTKQTILAVEMESTDKKTPATMVVTDMWLAPNVAGYEEVKNFYAKMAQKMAWSPQGGMLGGAAAMRPELGKGMAALAKEASKMDGVPMAQIVRMGPKGPAMEMAAKGQMPASQPTADTDTKESSGGKMSKLGGLAGGIGGFGGFGGKKKAENENPSGQAASPSDELLMEMTSETTSMSSAAIDPSKFEVPAGFKLVENEMKKMLNK